jgi:hypothetical protein
MMEELPFTTLVGFIAWAGTPVGLAGIGAAVSIWLRDSEWFEQLTGTRKSAYIFVITMFIVPIVFAYLPRYLTADTIDAIDPLFRALLMGWIAYGSSQVTHEFWNRRVIARRNSDKDDVTTAVESEIIQSRLADLGYTDDPVEFYEPVSTPEPPG